MRGILFDQPHVIAHAEEPLRAARVDDRCELVGGNFFEAIPQGGDAYLLKSILHDWNDEDAVAILRSCRRALDQNGTLIVIEHLIESRNTGLEGKLSDLNMMVITGGIERTNAQYASIFQAAGFRIVRVTPTRTPVSIIEGLPV
jgi:hypothetical protein